MFVRTLVQRSTSILAIAGAAWTAILALSGGFDAVLFGLEITAHDPFRPLLLTSLAVTVFILADGDPASPARRAWFLRSIWWEFVPSPRTAAVGLAAATVLTAWIYGTKAVGGADSYGYLSQSDLWAEGSLKIRQPFVAEVPWPRADWAFAPVGSYRPMGAYRPVEGEDQWTIVPLYPPGLPMVLAAAGALAGYQAKFMVVPMLTGLLVLATYGIGVRIASPTAGLIGAWLVATSPAILFMMMATMTDAPVAGVWATAFYLLLGRGPSRAAGAGALASLAVLIRPNLNLLVPVMGLMYLFRMADRGARWSAFRDGVIFGLACLPGVVALALVNRELYGSPLMSGYGSLDVLFSVSHIGPNVRQYFGWLAETQTIVALFGFAAAVTPSRRLWPAADSRGTLIVAALFVLVIWGIYFVYQVWDAWWYLRFLLPSFPFIMLGTGAIGAALIRWRPHVMRPVVAIAVIAIGVFQVRVAADRYAFIMWEGERRYVVGAKMTNQLTERNSLIIAAQHTGSLRYYGSRMTALYDFIPTSRVDRSLAWFKERGVHSYLLLEEWEVPRVRKQFAGQAAASVMDRPPLAIYQHPPGPLYLFDLLSTEPAQKPPVIWTGTDRGMWAVPRAPRPHFVLEP